MRQLTALAIVLLGAASVFGAAGDFDPAFNGGRPAVADLPDLENGRLFAVARQPDGKLVAAGFGESDSVPNPLIVFRYLADGTPDPTFGADGAVLASFGSFHPLPRSILLQSDGKIVVVASVGNLASAAIGLVRFDDDGSVDSTFGAGGTVFWSPGQPADAAGAVLQPDDSIVVAGDTSVPGGAPTGDIVLTRFSPDGDLDATFGVGGVSTLDFAGRRDDACGLARRPDGRLVVAGSSWLDPNTPAAGTVVIAAGFDADGALDATFGSSGRFEHTLGQSDQAMSLALLPDGGLLVAGRSFTYQSPTEKDGPVFFLRLTAGGSVDGTFGTGGIALPAIAPSPDSLAVTPAGDRFVAIGVLSSRSVVNLAFGAARFHLDGSPDTDFGDGGLVVTTIVSTGSIGMAGMVQPDGKIVEVGLTTEADEDQHPPYFIEYYPAVARFLGDVPACTTDADCGPCEKCSAGKCVWGARTTCTGALPGGARVDVATPGLDTDHLAESYDRRSVKVGWRGVTPLGFNPLTSDDVGVCLFADGTPVLRAIAPAGGSCAGRPCWKGRPGVAVSYLDKERSPDGISKLQAKASMVKTVASGTSLDTTIHGLPAASFLARDVVMQMHAGGACAGATMSESKFKFGNNGIVGIRLRGQ